MGKSTQIQALYERLQQLGIPVLKTREPGGTLLGEEVRSCLLKTYPEPIDALTELGLLMATRRYHLKTVIEPALAQGYVVLSDRFTDASRAYQGYGRGLDLGLIDQLHADFQIDRWPDRTILLDGPHELIQQRLFERGQEEDRIEQESSAFFARVRAGYLDLAAKEPERFLVLAAQDSAADISQRIAENLGLS